MTGYENSHEFRTELIAAGLLVPTSADGVYARSDTFEQVALGLGELASRAGADLGAERFWFAPIMPQRAYERTGYLQSFPDLAGSVATFKGGDREHTELLRRVDAGESWMRTLAPAGVMLCSAACHPLYELMSGTLPAGGRTVELQAQVYRHEPSTDPMRMQSFRQHEFVRLTDPAGARAFRDSWLERSLDLLGGLGLKVEAEVSNDPFFGRRGRMMSSHQIATELKYEIVVHATEDRATAIASANCHLEHFAESFGIRTADGEMAHTACVGFGLERVTLALLAQHGLRPAEWPADVRDALTQGRGR